MASQHIPLWEADLPQSVIRPEGTPSFTGLLIWWHTRAHVWWLPGPPLPSHPAPLTSCPLSLRRKAGCRWDVEAGCACCVVRQLLTLRHKNPHPGGPARWHPASLVVSLDGVFLLLSPCVSSVLSGCTGKVSVDVSVGPEGIGALNLKWNCCFSPCTREPSTQPRAQRPLPEPLGVWGHIGIRIRV